MSELVPKADTPVQSMTRVVRRRWGLVSLVAVLVTLVFSTFVYLRPKTYTSTATILITPIVGNAFSDAAPANSQTTTVALTTEAGLVNSLPVTKRVDTALRTTLTSGLSRVTASVPTNTELVRISFASKKRDVAQRFAQAYAEAFLAYRMDLATSMQKAQLKSLAAQATKAEALLAKAAQVAQQNNPPADAGSQVQLYAARLSAIQSDVDAAQALSTQPGNVVTPAQRPKKGGHLVSALIAVGGAVIGLILGLALASWRERRDDRIHAAAEPSILDIPVLACVPVARNLRASRVGLDADRNEAFRRARIGVLAAARPNSVIAFSAVSKVEESADCAAQVARAMAAAGYQVALVDAAVDGPHIAELMGLGDTAGLSDILAAGYIDNITLTDVDGVRVLTAGSDVIGARERYSGAGLAKVLEKLRLVSDFVLISGSPVTTNDGLAIVLGADSVILAVTDSTTTHAQIAEVKDLVRRLGVDVLGLAVMRPVKRRRLPVRPVGPDHLTTGSVQEQPVELGEPHTEPDRETGDDVYGAPDVLSEEEFRHPAPENRETLHDPPRLADQGNRPRPHPGRRT